MSQCSGQTDRVMYFKEGVSWLETYTENTKGEVIVLRTSYLFENLTGSYYAYPVLLQE